MQNVEKHIIKHGHEWFDYCDVTTSASKKLFNIAQFSQRQSYFYGWGILTLSKLDVLFKSNENYKALPAKVAQLVLKQNADCWASYFKALDDYKQEPSKFTVKPKPPSYIKKENNLVKFNYQAVSKKEFKKGFIVPSMSPIRIPVKPGLKCH